MNGIEFGSVRRTTERATALKSVEGKTAPVLNLKDFARERGVTREVRVG